MKRTLGATFLGVALLLSACGGGSGGGGTPAPAAPTGVTITAGDTQVALSWTSVTGAASYNVYYRTSAGVTKGNGIRVPNAVSGGAIAPLINGTNYHFAIAAVDGAGNESALSAEVAATPQVATPGVPAGVNIAPGDKQVTLGWNAVAGASSYNVYYGTAPGVTIASPTKVTGATPGGAITGLANGTMYYFIVTAVNAGGESTISAEVAAKPQVPAPGIPTGIIVTSGDMQVTISWTTVSGATSYNVYYGTAPGVTTASATKVIGATSGSAITGLANGTMYYFVVTAANAGGESAISTEVAAKPQVPAPGVPNGVGAIAGNGAVTVSWTAVAGAASYNVYYGTAAGVTAANGNRITNVSSGSAITGLTNGTMYYFVVTAMNAGGESAISGEVAATPLAPPAPPAGIPAGIVVTSGDTQVTLSWTAVAGATAYNVYYGTTPGVTTASPTNVIGATSGGAITGLANGTMYYFVVTAANAGGESAISAEVAAKPQVPAPGVPAGVGAIAGNGSVTVSWNAVAGATSYNVYYGTAAGVTAVSGYRITNVASGNAIGGLAAGTMYYFVVTAMNVGGESAISAEVAATPLAPPAAPTGIAAQARESAVVLNWTASAGATSYNVYYATAPGVTTSSPNKLIGATSGVGITGLTNGTTYYFVVTAVGAGGESIISLEAGATPKALSFVNQCFGTLSNSVAWSGTQYVAVGMDGCIKTSPDGVTWTPRNSGTTNGLQSVTWSGQFVAVGTNTILTSPDGITWTARSSIANTFLFGITWSGTQFVAVGGSGAILTSPDGITWTGRTSGTTGWLYSIAWSGTQFVAVGINNTFLTSPDGINWTLRNSGTTNSFYGVTWSGTQFVAVGASPGGSAIITSPDGINWTPRTPGTTNQFLGVAWSGTQFVAVGASGTIVTSPDGITWTAQTSGTTSHLYAVTWSGTQFVAVGIAGCILTSPDGINWALRRSGTANALNAITRSETQFTAVGGVQGTLGTILTSPDGMSWTPRTSGTLNLLNGVAWSGTQFAAVGNAGTLLTSPDGIAWTPQTSNTTFALSGITWSGTQFVTVGGSGIIRTSPDGINWSPQASGALTLYGITWSGAQFVAVGFNGTIITSPDGITWNTRTSGTTSHLNGVAWSGTQFAAVGNAGTIRTSPDGINWTPRTSGTTNILRSVTWSGTEFAAVGDLGTLLTSQDGITWTPRSSRTAIQLNGIIWSGTQFSAVGNIGTVLLSQ